MGYSTDFFGSLTIEPALKAEHKTYLEALATTRRMKRKASLTKHREDPARIAVGLPIGADAEYFVGASGMAGQEDTADVADYNSPPGEQPGLWMQWTPNSNGTGYEWDGGEKFYEYEEWLRYAIEHFFKPWGYTLNGEIEWQGEDSGDRGILNVNNNTLRVGITTGDLMSNPLFQLPAPPPAKPRCFACGNTGEMPTVAVFVRGGLVQDVCFDGSVRVVVVDFDCDSTEGAIFTDPESGRAHRANASFWTQDDQELHDDPAYVRAAIKTATDPYAPMRDNEKERARVQREIEENDDGC